MTQPLPLLDPALLWHHFQALSAHPRGSGNEAGVRAHIANWAVQRGFETQWDETGNLVVRVPGTAGREDQAPTILQGHLDMVCEKNASVVFDFEKDPIQLRLDGEWVMARGTTLGADNGIGCAAAMAIAEDPSAVHGPLELLFTVDEETGMTGARGLDSDLLQGRRMINLDTEEEGAIYIGCAGGGDVNARFPLETMARPEGSAAVRLDVKGLAGGHSGLNIHENRANAIKVLARVLDRLTDAGVDYQLIRLNGGSKRNAIPREASCSLIVALGEEDTVGEVVVAEERVLREEFAATDPELVIVWEARPKCGCETVFTSSFTRRLVAALHATPSGVVAMSRDVPGLVETSNNLGVVVTDEAQENVVVTHCTRSSIGSALEALRYSLRALYELAGADVELEDSYPGWKPNPSSPLLRVALTTHELATGRKANIKAVHAGLECGLLGERLPGLDTISIGPDIQGAHSPDERVHAGSAARFYDYLKALLEALV